MDSNKKVTFNTTTMVTSSICQSINQDDKNKLVKDIQNKIHQILQGKPSNQDYSNKLNCKVPLFQYSDRQKLCNKLNQFTQKYTIDTDDLSTTLNDRVLRNYKFNSLVSKRRLTRIQQKSHSPMSNKCSKTQEKVNKIFGTEWQEYQNIYDLHTLLCPNSLDMASAYQEVEFIKSKIKHQENNNPIPFNNNPQTKKTMSFDQNGIYQVIPNRPMTSRIIMKKDGNDRPKCRERFSFRDTIVNKTHL